MNVDIVDNFFVFLMLLELVENEVYVVNLSFFNVFSFLLGKCGFKMVCLNINSFVKYIDEFRVFFFEFFVDILVINEIKFDEFIKSFEFYIFGYEFICCDRSRNGGGVGFYIKFFNFYVVCLDLNVFNFENLIIEICKLNFRFFLIVIWYRFFCFFIDLFLSYELFIDKVDFFDFEYYLLGDLNCNLVFFIFDVNICYLFEILDLYGFN